MTFEGLKGKAKSAFNTGANFVREHDPAFAGATSAFLLNEAGMPLEVTAIGTLAMYVLSRAAVAVRPKNVKVPSQ